MAQFASIARPAEGTLIAGWDEDPHGTLQMTGAEEPLAKEEQDLLDGVHRFAAEVMRPVGERLDRMTPEEVIAAGSPLWQVYAEFAKLGIGVDQLLAFEPPQAARSACLILEELGWGDAGLASSLGVSMFPRWMAAAFGNQHLLELTPGSEARLLGDHRAWPWLRSARSRPPDLPARRRIRPTRLRGDALRGPGCDQRAESRLDLQRHDR